MKEHVLERGAELAPELLAVVGECRGFTRDARGACDRARICGAIR